MATGLLPKELHPDFTFPWKKPVGPVRIDAKSGIPRPDHLYGFSKAGRLIDFTGGHHSDPFDTNTKISRNRIVFNGATGSQIEFPDTSHSGDSSIFCDRAKFTISTVINFTGGTSPGIIGDFTGSSNVSVLLWLNSSGYVYFRTRCAGVLKTINGTASLFDSTDHHIIAQYDGANMYLIVDGQQVATTAQTGNTSGGFTGLLAIGSYKAGWSGNVPVGSIDHVAIWWSATNWEAIAKRRFDFLEPAIPLTYFIPSVSGRTATLTKTLGSLTLSGNSTLDLSAGLTKTLSALTLSSAASLDIDAQLNKSLSDLTLVSASTLDIQGSLSKALSDLTLDSTATATSGITGTLEKTLQALSLSSTGALDLDSSVSKTLESLTLSGTATLGLSASLSKTLEAISLSSSAGVDLDAQVSVTLGGLTLSSDAAVSNEVLGTLSSTLGSLSLSSTAVLDISASSSITLSDLSLASTGQLDISASFSGALEDLTLSAFGGGARGGTLNKTLGSLTLSSEAKVVLGRVGFYFSPGESSGDDLGFYDTSSDSSGDKIGFFNS